MTDEPMEPSKTELHGSPELLKMWGVPDPWPQSRAGLPPDMAAMMKPKLTAEERADREFCVTDTDSSGSTPGATQRDEGDDES